MVDQSNGDNVTPTTQSMTGEGDQAQASMEQGANKESSDTVKYESYRKVVGQNKRLSEDVTQMRERLQAMEDAEKARHEKQLQEQNQWQELAKIKEQEAAEARAEAQALKEQQLEARKLDAVLRAIPGKVDRDYWSLFDLDKVLVNPDTGQIEDTTVRSLADDFLTKHRRVVDFPASNARIDPTAPVPNRSTGTLSHDDWLALSDDQKQARVNDLADVPDFLKV